MATKQQQADFIARIAPLAQRQAALHDYLLFPSVTIAQAIHESAWGTSKKMIAANALFGVKVGSSAYKFGKAWKGAAYKTGTTEYYDGKTATKITDYFRQYDTIEDSICDYMDMLIHAKRYAGGVSQSSPEKSINGIIAGGYATGPGYATSIMKLINTYNLTRFDVKGVISNVCPYMMPAVNAKTLKRGIKGETVKALQWSLNEILKTHLVIDGCFGPSTEAAVIEFQKKYNLEPDGKAGTKTWTVIQKILQE